MPDKQRDSAAAIEEVVSELHRRGVERGQLEYDRLVAEARKEAASIIAAAESRRDSLAEEGGREARRLVDAARAEAEQLLHAFFGSLADIFKRRASGFLEALAQRSFSSGRSADTVRDFVAVLADSSEADKVARLQAWLDSAEPQSFLEALLILAMVFYSGNEGFTHFQIDKNLQGRLAAIIADPSLEPGIGFEFRKGIAGFRISGNNGREVEVSEESLKHMAEIWAGDEFRDVLSHMLAKEPLPGAARDV
jgi:F0F1-type ATP synthase membrane subunit b/b'